MLYKFSLLIFAIVWNSLLQYRNLSMIQEQTYIKLSFAKGGHRDFIFVLNDNLF